MEEVTNRGRGMEDSAGQIREEREIREYKKYKGSGLGISMGEG